MLLVSIIGDSISTYAGFNPEGYAVFYDKDMQIKNDLENVYDTWWAKIIQKLHAYLCVNNSYSGSRVTGNDFPAAVSEQRISNLHTGEYKPDIILIYIGFNDFGNGVRIYNNRMKRIAGRNIDYFADAYEEMLLRVKKNYPKATLVCGSLMRTAIKGKNAWSFPEAYGGVNFEDYNIAIRKICKKRKCCLADLSALDIHYETLDGTHPTVEGHLTIYKAWEKCLSELGLLK